MYVHDFMYYVTTTSLIWKLHKQSGIQMFLFILYIATASSTLNQISKSDTTFLAFNLFKCLHTTKILFISNIIHLLNLIYFEILFRETLTDTTFLRQQKYCPVTYSNDVQLFHYP